MLNTARLILHRVSTLTRIYILLGWAFSGMLMAQNPISGINWFPVGPADIANGQTYGTGRPNVSGRATVITVNPSNANDVWLGTATGGVWHSTNGGVNWLPMSDNEASLSIGAIALDGCTATGCATVYAGTGENAIRRDTYYGMGLLVGTTSGGEFPTFGWTLQGATPFKFASINNVALDPSTSGGSKVIYVTLSSGETASATESTVTAPTPPQGFGIFKSSNNASTWTKLTVPGGDTFKPTDLEMDPTNSQVLYAGYMGRGVFKTKDGGAHWCPLNPGIALPPGCVAATGLPNPTTTTFDHVQIAISPASAGSQVIYVMQGNCTSFIVDACLPTIFKSTNGGSSWTQLAATTTGCIGLSVYSRYTHGLTVDPKNSSTLFLGGVYLYKSTDGGNTFCDIGTNTVHPDHHAIAYPDPTNESLVFDVSDGGFASSTDGGNTWNSGNSDLQITQFQSIASSVATTNPTSRVIGGTQDNGTEMWVGTRIWNHVFDGDGGFTIMDRDDGMVMFGTNYYAAANAESTAGGAFGSWNYVNNGITGSDPAAFYAPIIEAPSGGHNLYYGTNRLYQSTNKAGSWTVVSPTLGGTGTTFPDIATTNVITAIAVAPSNANRIYVGYYDGEIFMTNSACSTNGCWTSVSKNLPSAPVTRIAVDPNNADIAYATFSGFSAGAHLFKTTNGGSKWTASATGLPSIPANTVTMETSSILWVGADDGVYRSSDSGGTWARYGNGLPHVPVYEISIDSARGRLWAGTQGRGVFILTQPFLSNFEGWVNNDIWDIPVYGNGYTATLTNPVGSPCTMQLIQQNGHVCASSTVDAQGGTISFDNSGNLVTSKNSFWNNKPVAWGCFNGSCIGGTTIAQCNQPGNPLTSVVVSCGGEVGIDHITGCPAQANPPSSLLGLSGLQGGAGAGAGAGAGGGAAAAPIAAPTNFDLIPSVQGRNGVQMLCTANVQLQKGDTPLHALMKTSEALNSAPGCQQKSVSAAVRGVPPEAGLVEDLLATPPSLMIKAPGAVGGQLFTSLRTAPGSATNECFDVNGLGSPIQNQIAVMKVDLETSPGGAAGGSISVVERSNLGVCRTSVKTDPGETAAQIATSLANLFQAPGIPGPKNCPAMQNPRDIVADGTSIISVVASELQVCNSDSNVGLLIGPKELPNVQHRALQYAAKFLCGAGEHEGEGHRGDDHDRNKDRGKKDKDKDDRDRDKDDQHDRDAVAQGRYYTAVNIHNPTERPAAIRVKYAAAGPDGKPGRISRFVDMVVGPDEVISIDCYQIARLLESKQGFIDGFAVIESDVELDVVAVYTAAGREGGVQSLHTERVPARLQQ